LFTFFQSVLFHCVEHRLQRKKFYDIDTWMLGCVLLPPPVVNVTKLFFTESDRPSK